MSIDVIDLLLRFGPAAFGLVLSWHVVVVILQAARRVVDFDRRPSAPPEPVPTVRLPPPPVPSRTYLAACGHCGQVYVGYGPCPHCGAPRI